MKKSVLIFSFFILIIAFLGYFCMQNYLFDDEQEIVEQKALTISMAIYANSETYLKEVSNEDVLIYLLHSLRASSGKSLNKISISSVNYDEINNDFNVIVEIHEQPRLTVLFHNMVFKKINNNWVLVSFSQDA